MPSAIDTAPAVWDPATGRVFTLLVPDATGTLRSAWGDETFAEMLSSGSVSSEAEILDQDEAFARQAAAERARLCRGPEPITRERFLELLNVLPPQRWYRAAGAESFRISEPLCGTLYTFCVRIGDRHFTLTEDGHTSHRALEQQCIDYVAAS